MYLGTEAISIRILHLAVEMQANDIEQRRKRRQKKSSGVMVGRPHAVHVARKPWSVGKKKTDMIFQKKKIELRGGGWY